MPIILNRLSAVALLCLALPAMAQLPPDCDMNELAHLPVSLIGPGRLPTIPGTFDEKPTQVLLDIARNESTLNLSGLKKMGFSIQSSTTTVPGTDLKTAHIKKLMVGQNASKGWFGVLDASPEEIGMHGGAVFLLRTDMEIALADKYVKFFKPNGCRKASLGYWHPKAFVVPIEGDSAGVEKRIWIKMKVNGREVSALISPATPHSYMDSIAAGRMGMSGDTPGAVELEQVESWRGQKQRMWNVPTKTMQIGDYVMNDVKLRILDMTLSGEMLVLGADFLRKHRVLISMGQRKVYFTPNAPAENKPAE